MTRPIPKAAETIATDPPPGVGSWLAVRSSKSAAVIDHSDSLSDSLMGM